MKRFIKKSVLFLLLSAIYIEVISFALIYTDLFLYNYPGDEIYNAIDKSKEMNQSEVLLLGDSVAQQLFPNETNNEGINSLACNQAIGIVGQYLLLNNYLEAGNKVEKVTVLYNPFSFKNNLDQVYTYHYFLKPFYRSEYTEHFSTHVKSQIDKIPYSQFSQVPHIKVTSWAPDYDPGQKSDNRFLSPISIEYLSKIQALSVKYDFELEIIAPPVSTEKRALIENMDAEYLTVANLDELFENYFIDMVYLDSSEFVDGTHFVKPEKYAEIIETMILN